MTELRDDLPSGKKSSFLPSRVDEEAHTRNTQHSSRSRSDVQPEPVLRGRGRVVSGNELASHSGSAAATDRADDASQRSAESCEPAKVADLQPVPGDGESGGVAGEDRERVHPVRGSAGHGQLVREHQERPDKHLSDPTATQSAEMLRRAGPAVTEERGGAHADVDSDLERERRLRQQHSTDEERPRGPAGRHSLEERGGE